MVSQRIRELLLKIKDKNVMRNDFHDKLVMWVSNLSHRSSKQIIMTGQFLQIRKSNRPYSKTQIFVRTICKAIMVNVVSFYN